MNDPATNEWSPQDIETLRQENRDLLDQLNEVRKDRAGLRRQLSRYSHWRGFLLALFALGTICTAMFTFTYVTDQVEAGLRASAHAEEQHQVIRDLASKLDMRADMYDAMMEHALKTSTELGEARAVMALQDVTLEQTTDTLIALSKQLRTQVEDQQRLTELENLAGKAKEALKSLGGDNAPTVFEPELQQLPVPRVNTDPDKEPKPKAEEGLKFVTPPTSDDFILLYPETVTSGPLNLGSALQFKPRKYDLLADFRVTSGWDVPEGELAGSMTYFGQAGSLIIKFDPDIMVEHDEISFKLTTDKARPGALVVAPLDDIHTAVDVQEVAGEEHRVYAFTKR